MNYPFFIARRLSLSSGNRRKAPAVTIAVAAVAISVAVMLASISIVSGFKQEIRDKVVGYNSHISVFPTPTSSDENNILTLTPSLKKELDNIPFIEDYSLQAAIPAVLKTPNDFKGLYLRGLSGNNIYAFLERNMEEGTVPKGDNEDDLNKIVISRTAARQLGLKIGDKIETYFISDDVRVRKLEITGIFNTHFDQYDDVLMYGSYSLVSKLGQLSENQGTYLQIITNDFDKVPDYTLKLQHHLNDALAKGRLNSLYHIDNVFNQGVGFFSWLALLDTNVIVILTLMTIVACITLISGMLIIILENKKLIGILRALGSPTMAIRNLFIFLSLRIALSGMLIGNILMIGLIILQRKFHFLPLDPDSYYIDFVPMNISVIAIIILNLCIIILMYLALVVPSRFVAGISPAETMRYE